jgi:hypothetical protein
MKQLLTEFLSGANDKLYRDLIQYHIRKSSASKLQRAALGETLLLSEELRSSVMDYIDVTNSRFGYNSDFWQEASCREAFERIIETAIDFLPIQDRISTIQDAFKPENQELAFQLFQITTLSFAYSASLERGQRKFMGIRKGIFG